jgi:hypothetical protein
MFHYGRFSMKRVRVIAVFMIILLLGSQYAAAQRSPARSRPLRPDRRRQLGRRVVPGPESIRVEVKSPTADITLNAAEIRFETVTVDAAGVSSAPRSRPMTPRNRRRSTSSGRSAGPRRSRSNTPARSTISCAAST